MRYHETALRVQLRIQRKRWLPLYGMLVWFEPSTPKYLDGMLVWFEPSTPKYLNSLSYIGVTEGLLRHDVFEL